MRNADILHSQFFHADDSDIVGLLCIARALEGGESDIVSSHHVWNALQKERPDVAKTLTEPIWYFDRKGETSVGEEEWIRTSIFYLEKGENPRVYSKYGFPFSYYGTNFLVWLTMETGGTPTMSVRSPASPIRASFLRSLRLRRRPSRSWKTRACVCHCT